MRGTELALWIADLSAKDGDGRLALQDGRELTSWALGNGLIEPGETGVEALARAFAEALEDEWLTCDYDSWPDDPEIPPRYRFRHHNLQRCRNIRITRSGWQSIPALRESVAPKPLSASSRGTGVSPRSMDIFICHATEDKREVARPIAERLEEAGWQVWFDDFELRLGDRLREGIDSGLSRSRYGAVILSPHFLTRKPWTEHELDGLMSREVAGGGAKVILPIWHDVGFEEVNAYSPALAGRLASSTGQGLDGVIADLDFVLRDDHGQHPKRRPPDSPFAMPGPVAELPSQGSPERLPESSIAAAREESVARAQALIEVAGQKAREVPTIVREALYQYFHDRRPLTVGGSGDAYTVLDAKAAVEHGFLNWDDDQPQALTVRHEQPTVADVEAALRGVRQAVFDGVAFEGKAEAGEWVRPLLKERYAVSDPTFELRPVWRPSGSFDRLIALQSRRFRLRGSDCSAVHAVISNRHAPAGHSPREVPKSPTKRCISVRIQKNRLNLLTLKAPANHNLFVV